MMQMARQKCIGGSRNPMGAIAKYEYAPLGELIRGSGPQAEANPVRFSTMQQHNEVCHLSDEYWNRPMPMVTV
jgi:hypothetical protein